MLFTLYVFSAHMLSSSLWMEQRLNASISRADLQNLLLFTTLFVGAWLTDWLSECLMFHKLACYLYWRHYLLFGFRGEVGIALHTQTHWLTKPGKHETRNQQLECALCDGGRRRRFEWGEIPSKKKKKKKVLAARKRKHGNRLVQLEELPLLYIGHPLLSLRLVQ